MACREIKENIYAIGSVDWDRIFFDALIPLPHGTSYNAYLIKGSEKTALIDTVDPTRFEDLKNNLIQAKVNKIDFVISNHAEQDHSGSLPQILDMFPGAQLVANQKCQNILRELLEIPEERFTIINDRDTLSLGNKTLEFVFTPWVHWPETMVTYLREDHILFSCDFFGSHLATSNLFTTDDPQVYQEAKRYYAEIMMPFAKTISKHLQTLKEFPIQMIAPSHGPIYKNPPFILEAYREWVSEDVKNEVVLLYISMHGSTERIANYLIDAFIARGIDVKPFNLITADIGEIALALVDAATLVFASPTFLMGMHPNMVYAAYLVNALKPKAKFAALVGSYSWSNKLSKQIEELTNNLKLEFLSPVVIKGFPQKPDFEELNHLADTVLQKHQGLKLI
ncbi:MAG: FprA family A-type flavoprotein [Calditrichia bacterium]